MKIVRLIIIAAFVGMPLVPVFAASKIIIVPGHDPYTKGAVFGGYTEADINLALAYDLYDLLKKDSRFEPLVTRDRASGEYSDWLSEYIEDHGPEVLAFVQERSDTMRKALLDGTIKATGTIAHNDAPKDVATHLYAINKYANDTNTDLVLHVHFNDNPRRSYKRPGEYSGFSIYVPERQYGNAHTSMAIARIIDSHLSLFGAHSTYPPESSGIVEDQDLIAIGVSNQRTGPSMLVEYSYIYEPLVRSKKLRPLALKEYAFQTYQALVENVTGASASPRTTLLSRPIGHVKKGDTESRDVLALQMLLRLEGFYPPPSFSFSDCPITGKFGGCTKNALTLFQQHYLKEGAGVFGPKTTLLLEQIRGRYK